MRSQTHAKRLELFGGFSTPIWNVGSFAVPLGRHTLQQCHRRLRRETQRPEAGRQMHLNPMRLPSLASATGSDLQKKQHGRRDDKQTNQQKKTKVVPLNFWKIPLKDKPIRLNTGQKTS